VKCDWPTAFYSFEMLLHRILKLNNSDGRFSDGQRAGGLLKFSKIIIIRFTNMIII
jgi:hypothetical protein